MALENKEGQRMVSTNPTNGYTFMVELTNDRWSEEKHGYIVKRNIASVEDAIEIVGHMRDNGRGEWLEPCETPDEEKVLIPCPYRDISGQTPCTYPQTLVEKDGVVQCPKGLGTLVFNKIVDKRS